MLSLLRLRVPVALRARLPAPSPVSLALRAPFRGLAAVAPKKFGNFNRICPNCRLEGHTRKECTQPTICVACGVEGHERKACPNPDPKRIEALQNAPKKCFRCGQAGHVIGECPQPAKCFSCGQTVRLRPPLFFNPLFRSSPRPGPQCACSHPPSAPRATSAKTAPRTPPLHAHRHPTPRPHPPEPKCGTPAPRRCRCSPLYTCTYYTTYTLNQSVASQPHHDFAPCTSSRPRVVPPSSTPPCPRCA
ncbi:hypothetical protein B0H10DRAFT_2034056 [Mycena sp. CBHHK59/15]|nr:hypothetical protein B0H10DRAFT_2034056 [Mycena sp. CBHHK59/15]